MRNIQTVLKSFASAGLLAAGLTLAGCQRIAPQEPSGGENGGEQECVLTATIADEDEQTKVNLVEDDLELFPRWSVGDAVVGWDGSGNTYALQVKYIRNEGRSALMSLTSGSMPSDGTIVHLVYAPGKSTSDISNKTLTYDLSTQSAGSVPALMTASAKVTGGRMTAVFHNRVAILAIKRPVMADYIRTYSSIKVSGPTSTSLYTTVTFSIVNDGLKATPGTGGVITKAVSFTSSASGTGPEDPICIALCPQTVALTLSTDNSEISTVVSKTFTAGTSHLLLNTVFGHPWVEIGGVKWATMNVGASTEASSYATCAGDWFAWGATQPWYTGISSWSGATPSFSGWSKSGGYTLANAPYSGYTKYTSSDHLTDLDAADDAATAGWGNGWRMPTQKEFAALYEACGGSGTSWTGTISSAISLAGAVQSKGVYWCTNVDGVAGALFSDGSNQVFFPAAGYVESTTFYSAGTAGFYWSSSLYSDNAKGHTLKLNSEGCYSVYSSNRYFGDLVRPVVNELTGYDGGKVGTVPDGALPGVFTVAAGTLGSPVRVRFSKGNLYWNGSAFNFETSQTAYPTSWSTSHVGHFFWSKTASVAYAASYSDASTAATDVLFTNDPSGATSPNSSFTANGQTGMWRTLTKDEWNYLINTRTNASALYKCNVTVGGVTGCLVIAPDGYTGTIASSYDAAAWATAESAGLVCLCPNGYRGGSSVSTGDGGRYYSSTPSNNIANAYFLYVNGASLTIAYDGGRNTGRCIRLVTNVD